MTSIGPDTETLIISPLSALNGQFDIQRPLVSMMQGIDERSCGVIGAPVLATSSGEAQTRTEKGDSRRAIRVEFSSREMRIATSKPSSTRSTKRSSRLTSRMMSG